MQDNPGKAARARRRREQLFLERSHESYGWATRQARAERPGRWNRHERRRYAANPSYFGVPIPRRILGLPGSLVLGAGAIAAYVAFTRGAFQALGNNQLGATSFTGSHASGGQWGVWGHSRPHAPAVVNAATGMVYQRSRPNVPPAGAQGEGEWVVSNCPDHSPGVCWVWEPLSTIAVVGVPPA